LAFHPPSFCERRSRWACENAFCGFSVTESARTSPRRRDCQATHSRKAKDQRRWSILDIPAGASWRGRSRASPVPGSCCSTKVTKPPVATTWFVKSCAGSNSSHLTTVRNIPPGITRTHAWLALMLLPRLGLSAREDEHGTLSLYFRLEDSGPRALGTRSYLGAEFAPGRTSCRSQCSQRIHLHSGHRRLPRDGQRLSITELDEDFVALNERLWEFDDSPWSPESRRGWSAISTGKKHD